MIDLKEVESDVIKKQGLYKKMLLTGQLTRFIIYLCAIIPAIVLLILAILASIQLFNPINIDLGDGQKIILGTSLDFVILAIMISTGIYGIYEFFRIRRVRKIDERFPDFVRDLAESRRAGMTFTKAIMYSARGNYGVLTPEIQKIARQISWGSSVDNALNAFSKRVNTKLIKRTISLIIEASRSGGNVADVLDAASKDARELKLIESERRAGMMSYVAIIYVGMMVFLLIIVVLTKNLLPSMLNQGAVPMNPGQNMGNPITQAGVTQLFLVAALVQSSFMGLVTGVFEEGNIISGVKHTFIMVTITWIVFKFIVTGI